MFSPMFHLPTASSLAASSSTPSGNESKVHPSAAIPEDAEEAQERDGGASNCDTDDCRYWPLFDSATDYRIGPQLGPAAAIDGHLEKSGTLIPPVKATGPRPG